MNQVQHLALGMSYSETAHTGGKEREAHLQYNIKSKSEHLGCTDGLNHQFTLLGACLADEIMSSTRVK
jgi:hypothetical protein